MADDFRQSLAPHFRQDNTPFEATLLRILALCVMLILPFVHYGARVLVMALFGVLGSVISEIIWQFISRNRQTFTDLNAVEIGLTCALLMPACADYPVSAFSAAAAIIIGKLPFGGAYRTPFVPSSVGYCLAAVCFPYEIFYYSQVSHLAVFSHNSYVVMNSPLSMLRDGRNPFVHLSDYFFGSVAGPLGTTSLLLLIIAAVWLWFGGGLAWQCLISFVSAIAVVSFVVPYHTMSPLGYIMNDLLGGSTLFCAVFMICCPNYCPKLDTARYIFGAACGVLAVIIQHFGANEAGGAFAALIMCPFSGAFDNMVWNFRSRNISYRTVKARMKKRIKESMKTKQERELDEIR